MSSATGSFGAGTSAGAGAGAGADDADATAATGPAAASIPPPPGPPSSLGPPDRLPSPEMMDIDQIPSYSPEESLRLIRVCTGPTVWVNLGDMYPWTHPQAAGQRPLDMDWARNLCKSMQESFMPTIFPLKGIAECADSDWPVMPENEGDPLPCLQPNIKVKLISGQHRREALLLLIQEEYSKAGQGDVDMEEIFADPKARWPVELLSQSKLGGQAFISP